jgi:hypothetical protein
MEMGVENKRRREGVAGAAAEKVPTPGPFFFLDKKGGLFRWCWTSVPPLETRGFTLLLLFGVGLVGGDTGWFWGKHRPLTVLLVYMYAAKGILKLKLEVKLISVCCLLFEQMVWVEVWVKADLSCCCLKLFAVFAQYWRFYFYFNQIFGQNILQVWLRVRHGQGSDILKISQQHFFCAHKSKAHQRSKDNWM